MRRTTPPAHPGSICLDASRSITVVRHIGAWGFLSRSSTQRKLMSSAESSTPVAPAPPITMVSDGVFRAVRSIALRSSTASSAVFSGMLYC